MSDFVNSALLKYEELKQIKELLQIWQKTHAYNSKSDIEVRVAVFVSSEEELFTCLPINHTETFLF